MRRGHVPERRCVACRRVRPQAELLRLVHTDGAWQLDLRRRAGGRGFWVCADTPGCWTLKRLGRTFRAGTDTVCTLLNDHNHELSSHEPKLHVKTHASQAGGTNV